MVSSTEELNMPSLQSHQTPPLCVAMNSGEIDRDINDYIETWLRRHERLRYLPAALKDDIKSELVKKADRMCTHWIVLPDRIVANLVQVQMGGMPVAKSRPPVDSEGHQGSPERRSKYSRGDLSQNSDPNT